MIMSAAGATAGLLLAPLLPGVIGRVKALAAGRRGPPVGQLYADLARLRGKAPVAGRTATAVFRLGPASVLGCTLAAWLLVPAAGCPAVLGFRGDLLAVALLLGAARFALVLAALDTGSAFAGMGASREVQIAAFAEPALLLALAALAVPGGGLSLSGPAAAARIGAPALALIAAALGLLALAENARIPVDDPATHLELTMIHEAMILDHAGPDLARLEYAAALKLTLFGSLLAALAVPPAWAGTPAGAAAWAAGLLAYAVAIGVVESTRARLRLLRVPQLLVGAGALAALSLLLELR